MEISFLRSSIDLIRERVRRLRVASLRVLLATPRLFVPGARVAPRTPGPGIIVPVISSARWSSILDSPDATGWSSISVPSRFPAARPASTALRTLTLLSTAFALLVRAIILIFRSIGVVRRLGESCIGCLVAVENWLATSLGWDLAGPPFADRKPVGGEFVFEREFSFENSFSARSAVLLT